MLKQITIICIIFILIFSNSAISSNTFKTLDSYYYILALGIDLEKNENYKITIQILENSSSSSESEEKPLLYSKTCTNIEEGLKLIEESLTRKINLSHTTAIILSNELLQTKGIKEIVSSLGNNTELRNTTYIFASSSTAEETLKTISSTQESFTPKIYQKIFESSFDIKNSSISNFGKLFKSIKKNNTPFIIPVIDLLKDDNGENKNYTIKKNSIINNGQTILEITNLENTYTHMILNTLNTNEININSPFSPNEYINLEIKKYKNSKIKTNLINTSPFIEITLYPEFIINTSGNSYDYLSENNIKILENYLNKTLENTISDYSYKIYKDYNLDLFDIKNIEKNKYLTLNEFKSIHLDKLISNSIFKIKVESKILSSALFNKQ